MTTYLSKEVREGMDAARIESLKKASRLRVHAGGRVYPVLRLWKQGFAVETAAVPMLRGAVDLYDGANHLYTCLIVTADAADGETCYEFKRSTAATDKAPLDFFRDPDAPVGLIGVDQAL